METIKLLAIVILFNLAITTMDATIGEPIGTGIGQGKGPMNELLNDISIMNTNVENQVNPQREGEDTIIQTPASTDGSAWGESMLQLLVIFGTILAILLTPWGAVATAQLSTVGTTEPTLAVISIFVAMTAILLNIYLYFKIFMLFYAKTDNA